MASFTTRVVLDKFRPKIPDKWKGGRLERIGGYFMNILKDYKAAVSDVVKDTKDAPKKATFYITLLTSSAILAKTNPSQTDFEIELTNCHHELLMLGAPIRNRISDSRVQMLQQHSREGTLRYTNCGLFSIIWLAENNADVDRFDAQCGLVKPRWKDFHKQIVDVGVLGRWFQLRKAMREFDINMDEWDENGQPVKKIA